MLGCLTLLRETARDASLTGARGERARRRLLCLQAPIANALNRGQRAAECAETLVIRQFLGVQLWVAGIWDTSKAGLYFMAGKRLEYLGRPGLGRARGKENKLGSHLSRFWEHWVDSKTKPSQGDPLKKASRLRNEKPRNVGIWPVDSGDPTRIAAK